MVAIKNMEMPKECQRFTMADKLELIKLELMKLEQIKQIVNEWNNDASHSFEDMCKINKIFKE